MRVESLYRIRKIKLNHLLPNIQTMTATANQTNLRNIEESPRESASVGTRIAIGRNYRLGVRLVSVALTTLIFGLTMVMVTLWLSWALEGAAAAINDTGSLRMQSIRIGLLMTEQPVSQKEIVERASLFNKTLLALREGDPQRPLRLPKSEGVQEQFERVRYMWIEQLQPALMRVESTLGQDRFAIKSYLDDLPEFVKQSDALVSLIEAQNAKDTALLRGSQMVVIVLMIAGCVGIVYLLYGWVIRPVESLRLGIAQMSTRNFSYRVPVEGGDELGELAQGFNDMASQLSHLYRDLEQRVEEKTQQLAQQNREISTLYEFSAYLSQAGDLEQRCRGFLARLIEYFSADGGTVRILDPRQKNLHLTVHQGLSLEFVKQEQCLHAGDCLCGEASEKGVMVLHDFRNLPQEFSLRCREEGFTAIAIAQIVHAGHQLGSYTLHFQEPREFSSDDRRLFNTLGQHLGVAIENQRLLARTRELAIAEERNLMAQGLHDSIAQGLNFLKLQVQMLEDSIARGKQDEVKEVIKLIELGVRESYDDVRELLTNFRIKLDEGDIVDAIRASAERFKKQTGIAVSVQVLHQGPPLPPEHQLQILFIVQEALSNIRKHANADQVKIILDDQDDFNLTISDNGQGFDADGSKTNEEHHIGLKIMRERAVRLQASLSVVSKPLSGTSVSLYLPKENRSTG